MIIKKLLFVLLILSAFIRADMAVFEEFDKNFSAYSAQQKDALYTKLKHIYIGSIMSGDEIEKRGALERLVACAKELGYDYSLYEKELGTLEKYAPQIPKTPASKPAPKNKTTDENEVFVGDIVKLEQGDFSNETNKTKTKAAPKSKKDDNISEANIPVIDNDGELTVSGAFESIKPDNLTDKSALITTKNETKAAMSEGANKSADISVQIFKNETKADKAEANKSAPKTEANKSAPKAAKSSEPANLISVYQSQNAVIFKFDNAVEELKISRLKDKTTRYIYDFKANRANVTIDFKLPNIKDLRMAQYDKNTLRIVFESAKNFDINYTVEDDEVIFRSREFESPPAPVVSTPSLQFAKKTIVIDAGHGGKDAGAVSNGKYEKNVVLQISLLLGYELKKRGYNVSYTRTKDVYLKLQERTKAANDKNADIFVSIHANAAPKKGANGNTWQGIETFFLSPSDSKRSKNAAELENQSDVEEMNFYSKQTFLNFLNREKIIASHKLAIDIQQYILNSVRKNYKDVADGGVREAPFWVLTGAQMPAVLLEIGYITDKTDRERMFDKKFQNALVAGVANGIDSYFVKNM